MKKNDFAAYLSENWELIKNNVRNEYEITEISYNTWIKPLKFGYFKNDTAYIVIPSDQNQAYSYISKKYTNYFLVTITEMLNHNISVSFILENEIKNDDNQNSRVYNINSENANLNSKYTFDTFIVGNSNQFAHSASLAVAESPGTVYNPLYLYGGSGLGKTHLMHSVGHFILNNNPKMKVLYVTSENFTNEIVNAIRSGSTARMSEIREKYRSVDVLMIDDVQYIIGKDATQMEFFNTFNELHSMGKQIILSSDKPPKELDTLEDRFRTRFEWGLIADLQEPDYETRMAILKKNAENYEMTGREIDNEVFNYIASNITTNIRELEGAYNKLIAYSRLHKVDISMDIVEDALKDIINPNKIDVITCENIINVVAEHFNISPNEITSKRRTSDLVLPRQICMYLCKELTEDSLQDIAKALNKKDHTTVMYGIEKITESVKVDKSLNDKIKTIKKKIMPS